MTATAPRPRKVLFIAADQWRAECLSALGHKVVKTPNLDALLADGAAFTNHYTQCTPCGPSRTSLLTGLYLMNHRSGRNGTPLDARHTNVALEARRAGMEPTLFGYTDTSADPRQRDANDPALKTYEGPMPGFSIGLLLPEHKAAWIAELRRRGYDIPTRADLFKPRPGYQKAPDRGFRSIPTIFSAEDCETKLIADSFINWASVRREQDWFAHVVFLRPHPPIIAPEPYNLMYHPKDVELPHRAPTPDAEGRQHPFLAYKLSRLRGRTGYDEHNPNDLVEMNELELRQMRATYYSLITQVDDQIGRIVAHLKATGEYDNTLIIFTCDHAEMLGDHYAWGKEIYFDQSFRIPLIIRDPRQQADATRGRKFDAFTEAIDVMPTILDWLGLDLPQQCDGHSLLPFLEGPGPRDWRQEVHFEHDFRDIPGQHPEQALGLASDHCCYAAIRDKQYKYVHFAKLPPLLFDMRADPWEMNNLAEDPAMAPVVARYAQKMLSWRLAHAERTLTHIHLTENGPVARPRQHKRVAAE